MDVEESVNGMCIASCVDFAAISSSVLSLQKFGADFYIYIILMNINLAQFH